jgi:hypothetical protein
LAFDYAGDYNPPGPFTPAFGGTGYGNTGYSYGSGYNPPGLFTQAFGGYDTGYGNGYVM